MATFVCVHGAGGRASDWNLLAAELQALGHRVVAMDLPSDEEVGLAEHTAAVVDAIVDDDPAEDVDDDHGLVLVAQSLAGFVAPLVCTQVRVDLMVLLAAMVPTPGETAGEWWANVGHEEAFAQQGLSDDSPHALFLHDVPAEVLAAMEPPRDQAGAFFEEPWPLSAWPAVPTRFLACRDDRFFPADWLRGVVKDRLRLEPTEIPGGHCAYLSQPRALARALVDAWTER